MQNISSCKALKKVKRRCMLGTPQDGAHNLQSNPRKIKNQGLVNRVRGKREQIEIRKTQVLYTLPSHFFIKLYVYKMTVKHKINFSISKSVHISIFLFLFCKAYR